MDAEARRGDRRGTYTPETGARTWIWSDLHLHHKNIIRYCSRPFQSVEVMNEALLAAWRETVGEADTIICGGDIALAGALKRERLARVRAMPGRKLLVRGNHDFGRNGRPADTGSDATWMTLVITGNPTLVVTHIAMNEVPDGTVNLYGHVHNNEPLAGRTVREHLRRAHRVPAAPARRCTTAGPGTARRRVRLFFVEEFLPYSWAFLPADASLQCSVRGDSNQASTYPRLSGGQPSLETVPNTVGLSPSGALPSGHSRGVLVRFHGQGDRPVMALTTGFQGRRFDVPEARTGVPRIDLPSPAPCAAADAVFADAKAKPGR